MELKLGCVSWTQKDPILVYSIFKLTFNVVFQLTITYLVVVSKLEQAEEVHI